MNLPLWVHTEDICQRFEGEILDSATQNTCSQVGNPKKIMEIANKKTVQATLPILNRPTNSNTTRS